MLTLLVTYEDSSNELIDMMDHWPIEDLRSHFRDPYGNFASSVIILGYKP